MHGLWLLGGGWIEDGHVSLFRGSNMWGVKGTFRRNFLLLLFSGRRRGRDIRVEYFSSYSLSQSYLRLNERKRSVTFLPRVIRGARFCRDSNCFHPGESGFLCFRGCTI